MATTAKLRSLFTGGLLDLAAFRAPGCWSGKAMPSMTPMMSEILRRSQLVDVRFHGFDHAVDDSPPCTARWKSAGGELAGLARRVGVLVDGATEFAHGGAGLFDGRSLLFGAGGQIVVALGDFSAGVGNALSNLSTSRTSFCSDSTMWLGPDITLPGGASCKSTVKLPWPLR